jgi:hypothetical protein
MAQSLERRFWAVVVAHDTELAEGAGACAVGVAEGEQFPVGDVELVAAGMDTSGYMSMPT